MEELRGILKRFGIASSRPQFLHGSSIHAIARELGITPGAAIAALLEEDIWPERFRRNQGVITAREQARLLGLRIFIAGCGGLGGELACLLCRMGAGSFRICDPDVFEESNLNRQCFCTEKTLGLSKVRVVKAGLLEMASWVRVEALEQAATPDNLPDLLKSIDIAIDCLDSVARKKMIEDAAASAGIPFLHGSVLGQDGFVYLDIPGRDRLNSLYPDIPAEDMTLKPNPVVAPTVCGTATFMASLLLNGLIRKREPASPLIHLDFSVPEIETFSL